MGNPNFFTIPSIPFFSSSFYWWLLAFKLCDCWYLSEKMNSYKKSKANLAAPLLDANEVEMSDNMEAGIRPSEIMRRKSSTGLMRRKSDAHAFE